LTLSPALCALLLKPHEHGHDGAPVRTEALPRLGIVVLAGLLGMLFLAPVIGPHFGIETGHGGHAEGEARTAHAVPPWAPLALNAATFAIGAVVGWFVAHLVNRGLGVFFKGFNWTFDRTIAGYGRAVSLMLTLSVIALLVYGGLLGGTV